MLSFSKERLNELLQSYLQQKMRTQTTLEQKIAAIKRVQEEAERAARELEQEKLQKKD